MNFFRFTWGLGSCLLLQFVCQIAAGAESGTTVMPNAVGKFRVQIIELYTPNTDSVSRKELPQLLTRYSEMKRGLNQNASGFVKSIERTGAKASTNSFFEDEIIPRFLPTADLPKLKEALETFAIQTARPDRSSRQHVATREAFTPKGSLLFTLPIVVVTNGINGTLSIKEERSVPQLGLVDVGVGLHYEPTLNKDELGLRLSLSITELIRHGRNDRRVEFVNLQEESKPSRKSYGLLERGYTAAVQIPQNQSVIFAGVRFEENKDRASLIRHIIAVVTPVAEE